MEEHKNFNFIEAVRSARVGYSIRRACWMEDVRIRWNWTTLQWEARANDEEWTHVPSHPNPLDITHEDWEVFNEEVTC